MVNLKKLIPSKHLIYMCVCVCVCVCVYIYIYIYISIDLTILHFEEDLIYLNIH